jgi:hypothetical protein
MVGPSVIGVVGLGLACGPAGVRRDTVKEHRSEMMSIECDAFAIAS